LPETVGAICADHGNVYSGQDAYSGRLIAEGGRKWPADVTCTLNTMYSTKLGLEDQHALHGAPAFVLGEKPSVIWREGDQANAAHCVDFAGTLNCDKGQQGGIIVAPCDPDVAQTLSARDHKGPSCGRDGVTGNPIVVSSPAPVAGTLNTFDVCDTRATVAIVEPSPRVTTYERHDQDGRVREVEVAPTLPSTADNCCELPLVMQVAQQPIAFHPTQEPIHSAGVSHALGTEKTSGAASCAVAFEPRYYTRDNKTGGKPSDVSALKADASKAGDSSPHVATALAVRRLTPRECERLQGFPDDYTAIVYRKKSAADGPRYKAMGNSMAVNCMAWIGERIAAVNARIR
jgi:hypothetical protein